MNFDLLDKMDVSNVADITTGFRAGVDDSLKTVNGFSTKATESLTAFRSSLTNQINSTLSSLTGNLISINDLASFVKVENGKFTFNQQEMISRVQRATGLNLGSKDALSSSITNQLFNTINQATNGMLGKIIDRDGNVILLDSLKSDSELGKLTQLVDRYLSSQGVDRDKFGYYDRVSTTAMTVQLIKQAAEAGNYEDVRSLYQTADSDVQEKAAAELVRCLPTVGTNGDFRTAAVITEMVGVARCRSSVPGLITLLFRGYRVPTYLKETDYENEAKRLIDFADVYSPGWRYGTYFGKPIELLTIWMQTSSGVLKLFGRTEAYAAMVYIGRLYTESTTQNLLKARWPDLATVELVGRRIGR